MLELSLREALQLGHNYIGTEHILLGLIREGDGVAAQVLVKLGADLNRVRQQVIQLLHGYQGKGRDIVQAELWAGPAGESERRLLSALRARVSAIESRLAVIEQRVGHRARHQRPGPADRAGSRGSEWPRPTPKSTSRPPRCATGGSNCSPRRLPARKSGRPRTPDLPSLAGKCDELSGEIDHLRGLLRRHGIEDGGRDGMTIRPERRRA